MCENLCVTVMVCGLFPFLNIAQQNKYIPKNKNKNFLGKIYNSSTFNGACLFLKAFKALIFLKLTHF